MNQKDQTPSNTPDPQWDELVARLQQDLTSASTPPSDAADTKDPADPLDPTAHKEAGFQPGPAQHPDLLPDESAAPPSIPHEPSAAEREAALRKLFNTGPLARGPRDYQVDEDPSADDFQPQEPPALGSGDPVLTLSWAGTAIGALGLLLCVIFLRNAPGILYAGLAILTLVGVVMLLRRLPKHRDPGDDGARV